MITGVSVLEVVGTTIGVRINEGLGVGVGVGTGFNVVGTIVVLGTWTGEVSFWPAQTAGPTSV